MRFWAELAWLLMMAGGVPQGAPPDGWIFVALESYDTDRGAFHDRFSGTLVHSEIARPHVVEPWATIGREKAEKVEHIDIAGGAMTRLYLPHSEGCSDQVISVFSKDPQGRVWNFRAVSCNRAQEERLTGLINALTEQTPTWSTDHLRLRRSAGSPTDVVRLGRYWRELAQGLDTPSEATPSPDGGFWLRFGGRLTVRFDREQRVAEINRK